MTYSTQSIKIAVLLTAVLVTLAYWSPCQATIDLSTSTQKGTAPHSGASSGPISPTGATPGGTGFSGTSGSHSTNGGPYRDIPAIAPPTYPSSQMLPSNESSTSNNNAQNTNHSNTNSGVDLSSIDDRMLGALANSASNQIPMHSNKTNINTNINTNTNTNNNNNNNPSPSDHSGSAENISGAFANPVSNLLSMHSNKTNNSTSNNNPSIGDLMLGASAGSASNQIPMQSNKTNTNNSTLDFKHLIEGLLHRQQNASTDNFMNPMSIEQFKRSELYIPLWDPNQLPIPLDKRQKLIGPFKDFAKLARDIVTDSHNSHRLIFNAKVMAYYSPKAVSILLRHKFIEWRVGIKHGTAFYAMLIKLLKQIVEKSYSIRYNKWQVDLEKLKAREFRVIDYIEKVIKASPVLENLNFAEMKPPEVSEPCQEGADILAQLRAVGHTALTQLLEKAALVTAHLAAKEVAPDFKDQSMSPIDNMTPSKR